ncbi:hypothetical protein BBK36DRAFT_22774 [Trichoderma citrinoviride]|uniref:Uncharacterized protein n=1 Tax=Trichoderma citrinoviride TaxID=58853 RepID=A0A2T4B2F7_9HYPO|nr:hypothetical protein BBK36DRAFT_22774 [Trichoderma citrinoviride]PTB63515.1 hypothetical protein BBK36DRAFT_22774 [Trichoderma citrinoviride]
MQSLNHPSAPSPALTLVCCPIYHFFFTFVPVRREIHGMTGTQPNAKSADDVTGASPNTNPARSDQGWGNTRRRKKSVQTPDPERKAASKDDDGFHFDIPPSNTCGNTSSRYYPLYCQEATPRLEPLANEMDGKPEKLQKKG